MAILALAIGACAPVTPTEPIETSTFAGFSVLSYVPADPVGIVYVFHGSGGSARIAEKVEVVDVINELVSRGYGYVATSSTDRSAGRWNTSSLSLTDNADLARLSMLHDHVIGTTGADASTPILALGMSNGAAMSTVFAQAFADAGRPVAAVAPFNGPVPLSVRLAGGLTVPAFFHLSVNDSVVDNARIADQHREVTAAGVPSELVTSGELPLFPRFTRIPTVDRSEQDQIMDELEASGVWDENGTRVVSLATATATLTNLVANDLPASVTGDRAAIGDQLAVILAEHEFSALHRQRLADFFDQQVRPDLRVAWGALMTGPGNEDEIDGLAAGADGSVFVTGKFEQQTSLGGEELRSAGAADIPMARFDATGAPLWVERYGGSGEDNFFDIDADESGAVATGIITGTVQFGAHTVVSAGATDCVVVSFANDGTVRWAKAFGGSGPDGCNEVVVANDGGVVTSLDTGGGWESPAGPIPTTERRETLLLRLDSTGAVQWARTVGGPGDQRGKSLAVGADGSIAFGGDTRGALEISGVRHEAPGEGRDAWTSFWSADGDPLWVSLWGGSGDDIAKGLSMGAGGVYAVGTFTGSIDLEGVVLDAGANPDLAIARFDTSGELDWATSIGADTPLAGAEVVASSSGGVLFAANVVNGLDIRRADGTSVALDDTDGGTVFLTEYRPDGSVALAHSIGGTTVSNPDEIDRFGSRVYLDIVVRGSTNVAAEIPLPAVRKDGSVWAIDLVTP